MTIAFVLGNGISRQTISPSQLMTRGHVYGCNALYRDFSPTVLVATDRPIATQIQESGYSAKHSFYTRRPLPGFGAKELPEQYFGFSSGPAAIGLAALNKKQLIFLIGFDMGPTLNQQFNNMYAGTEFYKNPDALPTYTGNWVKQLCQISADFPTTRFVRVFGTTTAQILELDALRNFEKMPIDVFVDRINNQKDF